VQTKRVFHGVASQRKRAKRAKENCSAIFHGVASQREGAEGAKKKKRGKMIKSLGFRV
jgi:hypothetical protein